MVPLYLSGFAMAAPRAAAEVAQARTSESDAPGRSFSKKKKHQPTTKRRRRKSVAAAITDTTLRLTKKKPGVMSAGLGFATADLKGDWTYD
jgi:hypothetical protein